MATRRAGYRAGYPDRINILETLTRAIPNRRAGFWVTMRAWCTRLSACGSQFVTLGIECAGFDVRDQLYELLADWERPTREWAAGPKNNAILSTVMSREQRAVAGRQAIGSSWASNVDAFDEMELPGGQRGKMSFSVEVGPKLGKRLAKRRRFVRRKGGASDPWINS
jgi:hypothetical protein